MKEIIARERRIVTARIADAVMNRIVPVEIVIGILSVPTAIMRLKRIVRPAHAGVGAGHNDILPGESKRPDLRRVRVIDSGFDCRRRARSGTAFSTGPR